MKARLFGLCMVLLGFALSYFALWLPLKQANVGVVKILYDPAIVLAAISLLLVGLAILLIGPNFVSNSKSEELLDSKKGKFNRNGWGLVMISIFVGSVGMGWLDQQFSYLGYETSAIDPNMKLKQLRIFKP